MQLSCVVVVCLLGGSVSAMTSSEEGDQELEVYVEEVSNIFKSLPGWDEPENVPTLGRLETRPKGRSGGKSKKIPKKTWEKHGTSSSSSSEPLTSLEELPSTVVSTFEPLETQPIGGSWGKSKKIPKKTWKKHGTSRSSSSEPLTKIPEELPSTVLSTLERLGSRRNPVSSQSTGRSRVRPAKLHRKISLGIGASSSRVSASPTRIPEELPFTVDEKPNATGSSSQCRRDTSYVVAVYKQCIYQQAGAEKDTSISEDSSAKFLKLCKRAPQLRQCIKETIIAKMERCLDEGIHETITNIEVATECLIEFICKYEADRIVMFIQDGGFSCLGNLVTSSRLLVCLSANFANHVFNSLFDVLSMKRIVSTCLHLDLADKCVQQETESCKDDVSVLITGLVFTAAKLVTNCETESTQSRQERSTTESVGTTGTQCKLKIPTAVPTISATQRSSQVEDPSLQTGNLVVLVLCALIIIAFICVVLSFKTMICYKTEQKCDSAVVVNMPSDQNNSSER